MISQTKRKPLSVKLVQIDSVLPYGGNPKIHTPQQIEQIRASIEAFGFNDPIAIDSETRSIIEGHGRLAAASELGMKHVPVIEIGHLSTAERRLYAIAHNKLTMNTGFDEELLRVEMVDLGTVADMDLSLSGFSLDDIKTLSGPEHSENYSGGIVPEKDKNIVVRLSFHPGVWLGKREEIRGVIEKIEAVYGCKAKIDE